MCSKQLIPTPPVLTHALCNEFRVGSTVHMCPNSKHNTV